MNLISNYWILAGLVWGVSACKSTGDRSTMQSAQAETAKLTATSKQEALWAKVNQPYERLPNLPGLIDSLSAAKSPEIQDPEKNSRTFVEASDEIVEQRPKAIHKYGVVSTVEFEPDFSATHRYSGLLGTKAPIPGLIRLSLAGNPDRLGGKFVPGLALKLFIDGEENPSLNVVAMYSLDGQKNSRNFFENSFSNVLPPGEGILVKFGSKRFTAGLKERHLRETPNNLSVEHLAGQNPDGSQVEPSALFAPKKLVFEPDDDLKQRMAEALKAKPKADYRELLMTLVTPGTTIYKVYAHEREFQDPNDPKRLLGTIRATSPAVASEFGDKTLHFQHFQAKGAGH